MPVNFNRIRWEKKIITMLLDLSTALWNERCTLVQVANANTNEIRYRQKAWEYCMEIINSQWKLPHNCMHLLQRDEKYFRTTQLLNVQTWYDNIMTAINHSDRKHATILSDIRESFVRDESTKNMKRTVKKIVRETADEVVRVSRSFQQNFFYFTFGRPSLGK